MTKDILVKPTVTSEFASCGQVDHIDMQLIGHGSSKWIMLYQDHLTKLSILRPSTIPAEVSFQLVDIFLLIGAPVVLLSNNNSEFTAKIIEEI